MVAEKIPCNTCEIEKLSQEEEECILVLHCTPAGKEQDTLSNRLILSPDQTYLWKHGVSKFIMLFKVIFYDGVCVCGEGGVHVGGETLKKKQTSKRF